MTIRDLELGVAFRGVMWRTTRPRDLQYHLTTSPFATSSLKAYFTAVTPNSGCRPKGLRIYVVHPVPSLREPLDGEDVGLGPVGLVPDLVVDGGDIPARNSSRDLDEAEVSRLRATTLDVVSESPLYVSATAWLANH